MIKDEHILEVIEDNQVRIRIVLAPAEYGTKRGLEDTVAYYTSLHPGSTVVVTRTLTATEIVAQGMRARPTPRLRSCPHGPPLPPGARCSYCEG